MNNHTQTIGTPAAIVIGMNAMIGASIFSLPSALIFSAGPLTILAYGCATALVILMAFALARVATAAPQSGAFFEYTRLWAGRTGGIICTLLYVTGLTIALALLAKITASYTAFYLEAVSENFLAIGIVLAAATLVCAGGKANKTGQIILLILTLIPMAIIAALSLSNGSVSRLVPFAPHGYGALIPAIKAVVFGFFGFEAIPALARHMRDPQKTIAPAIIGSIIAVGIIYCSFVTAILVGIPAELFTRPDLPLSDALTTQFPTLLWIVGFIRVSIIITILGTIHAMLWAVSELISACSAQIMAYQLSIIQATMICSGVIICSLLSISSIDLFFSMTALFITLAFSASIIPLVTILRRNWKDFIVGILGLAAASIIIFCALDGLAKHLSGSIF